jgi:hypothetical protein
MGTQVTRLTISWCEAINGASHRRSPTIPGQLELLRSVDPRNQCHGITRLGSPAPGSGLPKVWGGAVFEVVLHA